MQGGNKRSDFRLSTRLSGMKRCCFARHEEAVIIPPTVRLLHSAVSHLVEILRLCIHV